MLQIKRQRAGLAMQSGLLYAVSPAEFPDNAAMHAQTALTSWWQCQAWWGGSGDAISSLRDQHHLPAPAMLSTPFSIALHHPWCFALGPRGCKASLCCQQKAMCLLCSSVRPRGPVPQVLAKPDLGNIGGWPIAAPEQRGSRVPHQSHTSDKPKSIKRLTQ